MVQPETPRTDYVILLTRLGGHELAVNPDLIERAEATPDTVITMVDGHKLVIAESLAELVTRVRQWRAAVAAEAVDLAGATDPRRATADRVQAVQDVLQSAGLDAAHRGAQIVPLRGREG
jgi:flagellar protein FlbD